MDEIRKVSDEEPVVRIAYTIIQQAIKDGASKIRVEPGQSGAGASSGVETALQELTEQGAQSVPGRPWLLVSEKVGDNWRETMSLPDYLQDPITQQFKLMAMMDLACTDKNQEGRIPMRDNDKNYTLLVETKPTPQGEQVLMRFD